jgi:DMSO/TMAO reductase YedYZ heme-binding membrane subunit
VSRSRSGLEGPPIVAVVAGALLLLCGTGVAIAGDDWTLWLTRATARVSLTLFVATFSASAINRLRGGRVGKWLLRNRRYLGLSFATSHAVHAAAFFAYAAHRDLSIAEIVQPATLAGGSTGYVFIALMAITSTDAMTRRLGRRRWQLLHRTGMYVLFFIFAFTYLGPALAGRPIGVVAIVALAASLGLRATARLRRRK